MSYAGLFIWLGCWTLLPCILLAAPGPLRAALKDRASFCILLAPALLPWAFLVIGQIWRGGAPRVVVFGSLALWLASAVAVNAGIKAPTGYKFLYLLSFFLVELASYAASVTIDL